MRKEMIEHADSTSGRLVKKLKCTMFSEFTINYRPLLSVPKT